MYEYDRKLFQSNLKAMLKEHGYTQVDLAEHIRTTPTTIGRYISGARSPDLETLVAIAMFLHVGLDELCCVDPPAKPRRPPDETILASVYSDMSDNDRKVLWALLDRYMSPEQRLIVASMQDKSIIRAV